MSRTSEWIAQAAHPLATTDPAAPITDLEPLRAMVGAASIVGLARGAHGAREFSQLSHRVLRLLVTQLGFRSLAIETDQATGQAVDTWLQTGRGDPETLLRETHSWWRVTEFLQVLHWMRTHNQRHPDQPLRLVGLDVPAPDMSVLEHRLAANLVQWRQHTDHKILYWSGSHSAVGHSRTVAWTPRETGVSSRNAGSYLREQLGTRYLSIGLIFHHGWVNVDGAPVAVPAPSPDFTDATLATPAGLDRYLLDLRTVASDAACRITDAPAKLRLIGPRYDPDQPARMMGGPLSEFFDTLLHARQVTAATPPNGPGHRTDTEHQ